jgi:hypothetical protein
MRGTKGWHDNRADGKVGKHSPTFMLGALWHYGGSGQRCWCDAHKDCKRGTCLVVFNRLVRPWFWHIAMHLCIVAKTLALHITIDQGLEQIPSIIGHKCWVASLALSAKT